MSSRPAVLLKHLALLSCALVVLLMPGRLPAEPVSGAGSTLVFPLLSQWAQKFRIAGTDSVLMPDYFGDFMPTDTGLDYEPVGSLGGTMRVIQRVEYGFGGTQRAVDFAATEVPLKVDEIEKYGLAQFPIVMGGITVVTNLAGVATGALKLSGSVLADIFLGKVTNWSGPAVRALNPGVNLMNAAITVVHRADGSGSTYQFATYLAHASQAWRDEVGIDTELKWPVGLAARGSERLAEAVKATTNAIGYVGYSQAGQFGLAMAAIENRAGQFVAPSPASFTAAAASVGLDRARHFYPLMQPPADPAAYPILATVYVLVPRETDAIDAIPRRRRALHFFDLALSKWQSDAVGLGYVPLPEKLVADVKSYWAARLPAVSGN